MNLQNGQITVREILANPKAKAIIEEELPMLVNSPILRSAGGVTLEYVKRIAGGYIPPSKMDRIILRLGKV